MSYNARHDLKEIPSDFDLKPSVISVVKSHIPALLLSLYIFSFWILPQGWNEDNPLDGSWRYALGKFREAGFSLGRDSWFTYGPLAHWFGAPMGTEQYQPIPYYAAGLFVAGIIVFASARIFSALDLSLRLRIVFIIIFPFCFISMAAVPEIHLIVALFLLFVACSLQESADNAGIIAMIILGACGVLYKISFGIMSLFMLILLLATLFARRKIGGIKVMLCLASYVTILYVMFVITSGCFDLITYLLLGLETSGKYSEIMIRNMPYSPPNYIIALVYIAAGSVPAWQASKKTAGRGAALCLMTAYAGAMLFLFKHGFVRADLSHMRLFYSSVTPFLAVLALLSFSRFRTKAAAEKLLLCSASLILIVIYGIMLKILPGENSPVNLAGNWLTCGNRIVAGAKGENPEIFPAKRAFIRNSQPELFSFLNSYGRSFAATGRKPRITFYPWELIYFEGLEGFELAPSPALQLYSTGPHSRAHGLEAEFLSSEHRPDIVVIGPEAIDDRSPISELTELLPPLSAGYHVAGLVGGFTILAASETGKSTERDISCTEAPQGMPGEFLRISLDHPESVNKLFWSLAATLFKSPQLNVAVTMMYGDNESTEYVWRGYLSQLQEGVFYSPASLPDFFRTAFAVTVKLPDQLPQNSAAVKSAVAELRRSGGFWNLPVFPPAVPLKVKFCTFR